MSLSQTALSFLLERQSSDVGSTKTKRKAVIWTPLTRSLCWDLTPTWGHVHRASDCHVTLQVLLAQAGPLISVGVGRAASKCR